MSAALVQGFVVALVVAWSALFAAQRLLPVTSRRLQARLARALDRPALPRWLRQAARRLEPVGTAGNSCASGNSCSSCGGCAAASVKAAIAAKQAAAALTSGLRLGPKA